jgi:hypothetical protein
MSSMPNSPALRNHFAMLAGFLRCGSYDGFRFGRRLQGSGALHAIGAAPRGGDGRKRDMAPHAGIIAAHSIFEHKNANTISPFNSACG